MLAIRARARAPHFLFTAHATGKTNRSGTGKRKAGAEATGAASGCASSGVISSGTISLLPPNECPRCPEWESDRTADVVVGTEGLAVESSKRANEGTRYCNTGACQFVLPDAKAEVFDKIHTEGKRLTDA